MNAKTLRKIIRKVAGRSGTACPIVIVDGDSEPEYKGTKGHYRNKRGDYIRHPNAYRNAWGKVIYFPSTLKIEVGSEWAMHLGLVSNAIKTI